MAFARTIVAVLTAAFALGAMPAGAFDVPAWVRQPAVIQIGGFLEEKNLLLLGQSDIDYTNEDEIILTAVQSNALLVIDSTRDLNLISVQDTHIGPVAVHDDSFLIFENGGGFVDRILRSPTTQLRDDAFIRSEDLSVLATLDDDQGDPKGAAVVLSESMSFGRFANASVYGTRFDSASRPFKGLVFIDPDDGSELDRISTEYATDTGLGDPSGLAFTNDGRLLMSASETVGSTSISPPRRLQEFFLSVDDEWLRRDIDLGAIPIPNPNGVQQVSREMVKSLAINPVTQEVAIINVVGEVYLFDAELSLGTLVATGVGIHDTDNGQGIAFSQDGDRLAVFDHAGQQVIEYGGLVTPLLAGDYNGDGLVDAADYAVWRDNRGLGGRGLVADGNLDGVIDDDDYSVWANNYGSTLAVGAASTPEPTGLALAMLIVVSGPLLLRQSRP